MEITTAHCAGRKPQVSCDSVKKSPAVGEKLQVSVCTQRHDFLHVSCIECSSHRVSATWGSSSSPGAVMASTHTSPRLEYNLWTLCIVSLSFYQWPLTHHLAGLVCQQGVCMALEGVPTLHSFFGGGICHLSLYGAWHTECGDDEISLVTCRTGSLPLHVCLTLVAQAVFS